MEVVVLMHAVLQNKLVVVVDVVAVVVVAVVALVVVAVVAVVVVCVVVGLATKNLNDQKIISKTASNS